MCIDGLGAYLNLGMHPDNYDNDYDRCYATGNYTDQDCYSCPHNYICSAFEDDMEAMGYEGVEPDLF